LTVENDMNMISRAKGFIKNMFSSTPNQLSYIKFWIPNFQENILKDFTEINCLTYSHRINSIFYSNEDHCLYTGYYNGEILLYELYNINDIKIKLKVKFHNGKIYACKKLPYRNHFISTGKDCRMMTYDRSSGLLSGLINEELPSRTLIIDEQKLKIYSGNDSGNVFVYDYAKIPISKSAIIYTSSNEPITVSLIDFSLYILILSTSKGRIYFIKLQYPTYEKGQILGSFESQKDIRSIYWRNEYRELILGTQSGYLSFVSVFPFHPFLGIKLFNDSVEGILYIQKENVLLSYSRDGTINSLLLNMKYEHNSNLKPSILSQPFKEEGTDLKNQSFLNTTDKSDDLFDWAK